MNVNTHIGENEIMAKVSDSTIVLVLLAAFVVMMWVAYYRLS